ncbi:MAG: CBS domain-containing protein [Terrimicrobiaceae bacterium]|nr:CBS domain-containing protein [Terrimicrobiaceae bacterium]
MGIATILKDKGGEVYSVPRSALVADVVAALVERRIGAVLVRDGAELVGIVSERDIIRCLFEHRGDVLGLTAGEVMTAPLITISAGDSVVEAMELMTDRRIRHLPVMESGQLAGLVSIGDLVKRRIAEAEQEALALKDYITTG